MAFYSLCITIFVMFFQPGFIFPSIEDYQPLRNSAIIAIVSYLFVRDKSSKPFIKVNTNLFFTCFIIMQVLSSFFVWITGAIETLNFWIRVGVVYFLICKLVSDEVKMRKVVMMIVFGLAYLSFFSISKFIVNYTPGVRAGAFGLYENSNDLAIILVSAIPLAMLLVNSAKSLFSRLIFMIITTMFVFNLLFTGSRNGLLGLIFVGSLSLLSADKLSKEIRSLFFVLLIGAAFTVGMSNILSRHDLQENGLSGDESSENRIEQWRAGARMLMNHPLFGVGRDQFMDHAVEYGGIRGVLPHNTLVQVFAETGLPGGIFYLIFAVYPLYEARRYFYAPPNNALVMPGIRSYRFIISGLGGFWVCAIFSNRYQFYILYVLVAMVVAVKENIIRKQEESVVD